MAQKCIICATQHFDTKLNPELNDGWNVIPETFRVIPHSITTKDESGKDVRKAGNYIVAILQRE